ncbi:MAG: ABC transporter ATP-binding protein, partial [Phenylobacterium zucineum]
LTVALDPGDAVDPAVAGLTALLVEAAVPVFAIGPRAQSLEDIYRRVAVPAPRQVEAA